VDVTERAVMDPDSRMQWNEFTEVGSRLIGQKCIIRVSFTIFLAKLVSIEPFPSSAGGGQGVFLNLERPGFVPFPRREVEIGGVWNCFPFSEEKWTVAGAGTSAYFLPLLIENCIRIADRQIGAEESDRKSALQDEIFRYQDIRNRKHIIEMEPDWEEDEDLREMFADIPEEYS
jgi:hypothetical protein